MLGEGGCGEELGREEGERRNKKKIVIKMCFVLAVLGSSKIGH